MDWNECGYCLRTNIEEGAVIGISARVFGRIPKGAIIGSNGKIIKYRDLDKYEQLKIKRIFCNDSGRKINK